MIKFKTLVRGGKINSNKRNSKKDIKLPAYTKIALQITFIYVHDCGVYVFIRNHMRLHLKNLIISQSNTTFTPTKNDS